MKPNRIRRIIGVTALVLWAMAVVPKIILQDSGSRLVCQLDNWAALFAPMLSIAYIIMATIRVTKGKHWGVKLLEWTICVAVTLLCVVMLFMAGLRLDHKVWRDKEYVVYDEFGGIGDPAVYYLYKRNGMIDNRLCCLGSYCCNPIKNIGYIIYEPLNLIKEEADVETPESGNYEHITTFYRLSDGEQYEQSQNDSLWEVINRKHYQKTPSSR